MLKVKKTEKELTVCCRVLNTQNWRFFDSYVFQIPRTGISLNLMFLQISRTGISLILMFFKYMELAFILSSSNSQKWQFFDSYAFQIPGTSWFFDSDFLKYLERASSWILILQTPELVVL
jgi:hypothetical protein